MKEIIYYADLTPCDDLHNYKEAAYIPKFIEEDTKHFDTKPPLEVVQLATPLGWCIVAKWDNNGSTRIYAKNEGAVRNGVKILRGICGSCNCDYAFGNEVVYTKEITEKDIYVFDGHTLGNDKEYMEQYKEEVNDDNVNHPKHYTWLKELCGIEVIDITRHMNFCCGNALKYILRAGHKKDASLTDTEKQIEDLNKAIWYLKDEIKRITEFENKTKV